MQLQAAVNTYEINYNLSSPLSTYNGTGALSEMLMSVSPSVCLLPERLAFTMLAMMQQAKAIASARAYRDIASIHQGRAMIYLLYKKD